MNKEIIEEAAENYAKQFYYAEDSDAYSDFIAGAKYQAERIGLMEIELSHTKTLLASCEKALEESFKQQETMYSEEDMKLAFEAGIRKSHSYKTHSECWKEWFEQYKKK
jgi:hypothetical protein